MITNLLSKRLKLAKREITALKTYHLRGIGNMIVYQSAVQITYSGGSRLLNLTVYFNSSSTPYPFVQVYGEMKSGGNHEYNLRVLGGGYTNDGHTYKMMGVYLVEDGLNSIHIESTVPPESISYKWGR